MRLVINKTFIFFRLYRQLPTKIDNKNRIEWIVYLFIAVVVVCFPNNIIAQCRRDNNTHRAKTTLPPTSTKIVKLNIILSSSPGYRIFVSFAAFALIDGRGWPHWDNTGTRRRKTSVKIIILWGTISLLVLSARCTISSPLLLRWTSTWFGNEL